MKGYTFILFVLFTLSFNQSKSFPLQSTEDKTVQVEEVVFQIDSLNDLAYSLRRSNPRLALELALRSYSLCDGIEYPKGMASALHSTGTAKLVLGRYQEGLDDLMRSSTIRVQIEDHSGLVTTLNNIGYAYAELGNDDKALEYYQRALSYQDTTSYFRELGILYNNIGNVNLRKQDFETALEFFNKALKLSESEGDERGAAESLGNIGLVYQKKGDYKKGLDFLLRAYDSGKNLDDKFGMIYILYSIAETYYFLGQNAEATNFALRSMLIAQEVGSLTGELQISGLLAKVYEARGKHKDAVRLLKLESQLKDSLYRAEQMEDVRNIEAAYETERKVKENELLRKEQSVNSKVISNQRLLLFFSGAFLIIVLVLLVIILRSNRRIKSVVLQITQKNAEILSQKETIQQKVAELNENNKELENINSIKNKLISVIAHDLKNPFNSIIGYSELLVTDFNNYAQDEVKMFLNIIHDNAIGGNMLLDNLLQWSRLQTRTIQYLPVVHNLARLVTDEFFLLQHKAKEKGVSLVQHIADDLVVFADSNMLKTVIRNLVSNALKFTPKNGSVTINAKAETNSVLVSVVDTGQGVEPHIKEKLFTGEAGVSTVGNSGEKGTGLGLMLCKDFIQKHNGDIWLESKPGEGAAFFFRLLNKPGKLATE